MRFYGREKEIAGLRHLLDTVLAGGPSRLAAVTGKHRIGKTTLLLKAFEEAPVPVFYCFAARMATEKDLGAAWASEFTRGFEEDCALAADTPARAIEYVLSRSERIPCVILIEGCEALATASPDFWPRMQALWERGRATSRTLLVFAGRELAMEETLRGPGNSSILRARGLDQGPTLAAQRPDANLPGRSRGWQCFGSSSLFRHDRWSAATPWQLHGCRIHNGRTSPRLLLFRSRQLVPKRTS